MITTFADSAKTNTIDALYTFVKAVKIQCVWIYWFINTLSILRLNYIDQFVDCFYHKANNTLTYKQLLFCSTCTYNYLENIYFINLKILILLQGVTIIQTITSYIYIYIYIYMIFQSNVYIYDCGEPTIFLPSWTCKSSIYFMFQVQFDRKFVVLNSLQWSSMFVTQLNGK